MPRIVRYIIISAVVFVPIYGLRSCGHADPQDVANRMCAATTPYEAIAIGNEADDDGWDSGEADKAVELLFEQCPDWATEVAQYIP